MDDLTEGELAPDFTLPASGGRSVSLQGLRGRDVILYFYPKDDTSGCTAEACGFRDVFPDLTSASAEVVGISPDDVSSHDRFAAKYGLPFTLLADTDHAVAEKYGVWREKQMYGKSYMGIERSTFLIGPDGRIKKVWRQVKPQDHAVEVLDALAV